MGVRPEEGRLKKEVRSRRMWEVHYNRAKDRSWPWEERGLVTVIIVDTVFLIIG